MKSYKVTLYYHSCLSVMVEAGNEQEAIELAREESNSQESIDTIIEYIIEDDIPDVEEIK